MARKPLSEQYRDYPFWREWAYDVQCPYCGHRFTQREYEDHIPCPEDKTDIGGLDDYDYRRLSN